MHGASIRSAAFIRIEEERCGKAVSGGEPVEIKNIFADCPSRLPVDDEEKVIDDLQVVACTMLDEKGCIDEQEWKDATGQDQVLQELIRNLGREVAIKLVRPWMIDVELLEEKKIM
ncbi:hypothetical protein NDU88_004398 [Pleurodeles waltl]|uniref:Uncharacterized protein n=1 Tax=Pleurodeles waltl TaxID=8319 RepID=A0AAV7SIP3_PLEWA|nr:hypothetical protein NDU88_004398 [Pleurodeles waltl]